MFICIFFSEIYYKRQFFYVNICIYLIVQPKPPLTMQIKKYGFNGRKMFFIVITLPTLIFSVGVGIKILSFVPLLVVLGAHLISFGFVIPISNQIYIFRDYFLVANSLIFWKPKLRFDLKKVQSITLDTHLNLQGNNFKMTIQLQDGRNFSYIIYSGWRELAKYLNERKVVFNSFYLYVI